MLELTQLLIDVLRSLFFFLLSVFFSFGWCWWEAGHGGVGLVLGFCFN